MMRKELILCLVALMCVMAASLFESAFGQPNPIERLIEAKNLIKEKGSEGEVRENSEKALGILTDFVAENPDAEEIPFVEYLKGICLIRLGRFSEAAGAFEDALRMSADSNTKEGALWHLGFAYSQMLDYVKAKAAYERFQSEFPESSRAADVGRLLAPLRLVGTRPPAFRATDINGNELDLKKLSGKVVLLDFWATWCDPCRKELLNVKDAFERYSEKGLVIIGISLDTDSAALAEFVRKNGMKWAHYCDGKGWQSPMAKIYQVNSIPMTFLIDRRGVIRHTSVRGESLLTAIALLLNEP